MRKDANMKKEDERIGAKGILSRNCINGFENVS